MSEEPNRDEDRMILTKCTSCGRMMMTMRVGTRRVCKECLDKVNKPISYKDEEEKWLSEKKAWADEERRMWQNREVG